MTKPKITETKTVYTKKAGTKTVWVADKTETKEVDGEYCRRVEESAPFFRRLGGSETIERGYTYQGYRMVRNVSTSPDRQTRTVRAYEFAKE